MKRKASLEMEKIAAWVLGVALALVVLYFIAKYLSSGSDGSIFKSVIDRIKQLG